MSHRDPDGERKKMIRCQQTDLKRTRGLPFKPSFDVFALRMESASSLLTSCLCAEAARVLILVQIAITKVELENRDEGLERGRRSHGCP